MAGMCITTFNWTVGPLAISSQVPYYVAEWDSSLPDVIQFVSPASIPVDNSGCTDSMIHRSVSVSSCLDSQIFSGSQSAGPTVVARWPSWQT